MNAGNTSQTLDLTLDVPYQAVNGTILEAPIPGDLNAFNYFNNATAVVPKPIAGLTGFGTEALGYNATAVGMGVGRSFNWTVPAYSVVVLQFDLCAEDYVGGGVWNGTYRHQSWRRGTPSAAATVREERKVGYELEQVVEGV